VQVPYFFLHAPPSAPSAISPIASERCDYALRIPAGSALHAATYAGILPHEVLPDAGGTAAEISEFWHLASGIS